MKCENKIMGDRSLEVEVCMRNEKINGDMGVGYGWLIKVEMLECII